MSHDAFLKNAEKFYSNLSWTSEWTGIDKKITMD